MSNTDSYPVYFKGEGPATCKASKKTTCLLCSFYKITEWWDYTIYGKPKHVIHETCTLFNKVNDITKENENEERKCRTKGKRS